MSVFIPTHRFPFCRSAAKRHNCSLYPLTGLSLVSSTSSLSSWIINGKYGTVAYLSKHCVSSSGILLIHHDSCVNDCYLRIFLVIFHEVSSGRTLGYVGQPLFSQFLVQIPLSEYTPGFTDHSPRSLDL